MKRYNMKVSTGFTNKERFIEDPDGEWVKYEDVKALEKQNAENEKIINSMYAGTWYNAPKGGKR